MKNKIEELKKYCDELVQFVNDGDSELDNEDYVLWLESKVNKQYEFLKMLDDDIISIHVTKNGDKNRVEIANRSFF